jgi:hypothetical protein
MATLSAAQLAELATVFETIASDIGVFLSNADDTLNEREERGLTDAQNKLGNFALSLSLKAAQTAFSDSDDAFAQLNAALREAEKSSKNLASDAKHLSQIVAITASVVDLGAALTSGNALAVGKTLNALKNAMKQ